MIDVKKLFELSKIKYQNQILEEVTVKIGHILEMVDSMHLVNCENSLEDMQTLAEESRFRNDEVASSNTRSELFSNLPNKERDFAEKSGYYRVPRVVDN